MGTVQGPFYSYAQLEGLWISAGGDPGAAQMAAAIAMAESGGGVNSVNGNSNSSTDRGLWQINSIHGSLSTYDVQANARAAVQIYKDAGNSWTPWTTYTSGAYQSQLRSVPPDSSGGGGGGGSFNSGGGSAPNNAPAMPGAAGATSNPTPKLSMADLQSRYGFTAAMLNADSSLKKLFNSAVSQQFSDSRFQAELMGTTWWRSQTDTARQYWLKKFTDPATATAQYNQHQAEVNTIASEFGISMFTNAAQRKLVDRAAAAVINQGWNSSQLRNFFASNIGNLATGQEYGGKLGQFQDQIIQSGYKNGIPTPAGDISNYVKKLALGTLSMEQVQHDIRMKAANTFTAYRTQLLAGQDMADIAAPYIKTMSQLLEMPEGDISLFTPLIKNNLQWKDPSGSGKAPAATPLWQFEQTVRGDPRWQKTNNARDAVMTDAHKVLTDFGVSY